MNNRIETLQKDLGGLKGKITLLLREVRFPLSAAEELLSFENLSPAEQALVNEIHTKLAVFETQLEYFLR